MGVPDRRFSADTGFAGNHCVRSGIGNDVYEFIDSREFRLAPMSGEFMYAVLYQLSLLDLARLVLLSREEIGYELVELLESYGFLHYDIGA
jgi:hypothetical protein